MSKSFSVLYWNIWLNNQINGQQNAGKLLGELKRIVTTFQPDYIGLNEVLQAKNTQRAFILDFLKTECGYNYTNFSAASPLDNNWIIGGGFCSKKEPIKIAEIPISKDTPAERRGHFGCHLNAIAATVSIPEGQTAHILVAHPMHLRTYTIKDHYEATANLDKIVRSEPYKQNTILGGDFNEPGLMPKAFKNTVKDVMHSKTSNYLNATWRHNAHVFTPIRANLDQLYWSKGSNFHLQKFEVVATNASDHRPLVATFTFSLKTTRVPLKSYASAARVLNSSQNSAILLVEDLIRIGNSSGIQG